MRDAFYILIAVVTAGCASRPAPPTVEEARAGVDRLGAIVDGPGDASAGRGVFQANCSPCHGEEGTGDGPAAEGLEVPPRDLTSGIFQYTSTEPGQPPTDGDLFRTILEGVQGTAMPPWRRQLTDRQIWNVVQYVKRLSPAFEGDVERTVVPIPEPPGASQSEREKGRALYERYGCGTCHGYPDRDLERPILTDDRGRRIEATQFAEEKLAGGSEPTDIYRCIAVGIGGTPMPAFYEALKPRQIWQLAYYIRHVATE